MLKVNFILAIFFWLLSLLDLYMGKDVAFYGTLILSTIWLATQEILDAIKDKDR